MSQKKKIYNKKQVKSKKGKKVVRPVKKVIVDKPIKKQSFVFVLLAISILTFLAYSPTLNNEFTNWDDNSYVENNPVIHELSQENIKEMFFSENEQVRYHMGNYHPLTMLSLTLDHTIENKFEKTFKTKDNKYIKERGKPYPEFDPNVYQLHNITLHIFNSVLVFFFVFLLFGKLKNKQRFLLAAFSSLLFGVTTIHVESVTWISERKDVLYTFYYLISAILYLKFLEKRNFAWFAASLFVFLLSLLSKGQAVSLAVTLVAVDIFKGRTDWKRIIPEKVPYFLLALVFGLIAVAAQSAGEAIHNISDYPFYHRILFAAYGLTMYFAKLIFPFNMAAVYPYPYGEVPSYFWAFLIPLAGIIALFFYTLKKNKTVAFGIAFFVINVFLVLQLLPVGSAIMADRYAYVPSIGFAIIVAYLVLQINKKAKSKTVPIAIISVYALVLSIQTYGQTKVWKDSNTLWEHTLKISPKAVVAWNNWGSAIDKTANNQKDKQQKLQLKYKAIEKFTQAVNLKHDYAHAFYNRGTSRKDIGLDTKQKELFDLAIKDFNRAIEINPEFGEAYQNRAISKENAGLLKEALLDFNNAIQYKPNSPDIYSGRGVVYGKLGDFENAIADFNTSIRIDPMHNEGYSNRGYAYYLNKNTEQAIKDYNKALEIEPGNPDAMFNRGVAYASMGRNEEALADYNRVEKAKPDMQMLFINRGIVLLNMKQKQQACADFQRALQLGSPYAQQYIEVYCK